MDGLRGLMRGVDTDVYASDEEGPECVCRPKKFGRAEDEGMDEGKRNHEAMMMMGTEAQCRDEEEDRCGDEQRKSSKGSICVHAYSSLNPPARNPNQWRLHGSSSYTN